MAPTERPSEMAVDTMKPASPTAPDAAGGSASPDKPSAQADADTDALIAVLNEAESGYDADAAGRQADSASEVLEILDEEQILLDDEPLAGAPDPIDLTTRRAKNETPRDRIAFYERELAHETRRPIQALLQHEIGVQTERQSSTLEDGDSDTSVSRAYALALATDPSLRPNLWALRRIFHRRGLWPSLLKLLDTEARFAKSRRERAEVWTEKGHLLEDLLGEVEEAIICYQTAHELDPGALGPLAALEKVMTVRGEAGADGSQRPSAELLTVYRGLVAATREPGRRVALLIEQARIEEDFLRAQGTLAGDELDRVLSYLHDAYDAADSTHVQMRVLDEVIRLTQATGRLLDCLNALEVKAEILEFQAQQAVQPRQQLLVDQVVAIRRFQTSIAQGRLGNGQLAWQYLDKAHQRSPGDPLLMPDLVALAESQGRYGDLARLLEQLEEQHRLRHGDDGPPPLGLWLKRAVALRLSGQDALADTLEQHIATVTPAHLLLLLGRQRRAMAQQDAGALGQLFRDEAKLAAEGLAEQAGGPKVADPLWAVEALLAAAYCALRAGDGKRAEEALTAAAELTTAAGSTTPQQRAHGRQLADAREEVLIRGGKWAELARLYEQRLSDGSLALAPKDQPLEVQRLSEALVDLYGLVLDKPARAAEVLRGLIDASPDDLRLRRRAVLLARRQADAAGELAALVELDRTEQRLALGGPRPADLLRRAELLASTGDAAGAIAVNEEVLRLRPGDAQALDALETLLRSTARFAELSQLLRAQIESAQKGRETGAGDRSDAEQRLLNLQVKLADLLENELEQPAQAIQVYRGIVQQRAGYWPALRALLRLYRKQNDLGKQIATLEQLAEVLPAGAQRGEALVQLGELIEATQPTRTSEAEAAFSQALGALPLPSGAAAHAALGRLRAAMQRKGYTALGEVIDALSDSLGPDESLAQVAAALLTEERTWFEVNGAQNPTSLALGRAETQLGKAAKDVRAAAEAGAQPYDSAPVLIELGRLRVAQKREDGKQQGAVLAALAQQLEQRLAQDASAEPRAAVGELWLRAGLLGALNEDEPGQQADAVRRLLAAYRLLGDAPAVVVPLCDLLGDLGLLESVVREPELIPVLRARQALCDATPGARSDDQLLWTLTEAEVWLIRASDPDLEESVRASHCHHAAEAARRGLLLSPRSVPALLLMRLATAPTEFEADAPLRTEAQDQRLRAYALYSLKLAAELSQAEAKAELYTEAAQLLQKVGDTEAAAAAMRTALDFAPHDTTVFGRLHALLSARAEGTGGDAGPLMELLNFRLGLAPESDAQRRSEQALRVSLLLQRASLHQATGQDDGAVADLQALLALDDRHAVAHRRLAALLATYGHTQGAIEHYELFLQLDPTPAERQSVHTAVAKLLHRTSPQRAAVHVRQAVELGQKFRELRGDEVATAEELTAEIELYRWLYDLELAQGQPEAAVKTLRELEGRIPPGPSLGAQFVAERQRAVLDLATVLEQQVKDRPGALSAIESFLEQNPVALGALDRLVSLTKASEPGRAKPVLERAVSEARKQIAGLAAAPLSDEANPKEGLSLPPFEVLPHVFQWQGQPEARSLANQAMAVTAAALGQERVVHVGPQLALKLPTKPLGPVLKSAAFSAEARGVLLELWTEVWETANKLLAPDLTALGTQPRERLNGREVPQVWASVDQLAHCFGLGGSGIPYGLYLSRERELCQLSGSNIVCGSTYASSLPAFPPGLFFRLVRRLALLPDRLGPVEGDLGELTLLLAACCQLVQVTPPTLSAEQKAKLDERTRTLDRTISRKERSALRALVPRLSVLAGDGGRDLVASWRQAVVIGSAQLGLCLGGNLAAALSDLGVSLTADSAATVRIARALVSFAVSAEILALRRELGLGSDEAK